jgi:hypothetical protein
MKIIHADTSKAIAWGAAVARLVRAPAALLEQFRETRSYARAATRDRDRRVLAALSRGKISLVLALVVLAPVALRGQGGSSGAITGTVQDAQGGVIQRAQVVVTNMDTGVTVRRLNTTGAGTFSVTLLPPGNYKLEVKAAGFAALEVNDVVVRITETTEVPITLAISGLSQSVTVAATAPAVQLDSPTTGETIGPNTASTLPLSTRNFLTLLTLSAGANTELFDSAALGRGQVTINVNGPRPTNNNYQLEGINANDFNLPILDNVPLPNPDTVAEFKTQTSLYDASQGRNGGGNIQVNLKSGTDKFHGDAYNFFRDRSLNANDFFLNREGQRKPQLHQNQFGGSLGGPVPKLKDFFFFGNYQGTREASGQASGTNLATNIPVLPADRSAASLQSAFFPNGLPSGFSQLDPVALAFLNLPASKCPGFNDGTHCIPTLAGSAGASPSGAVNLANITRAGLGRFRDDQFTSNLDKQIGANDKISGRFFFSNNNTIEPFGTTSSSAVSATGTLPFPEAIPASNRFFKLGWTHTLSANAVNEAHFGFNRFQFSQTPTNPISLADIGATRGNSAQFPATYQIIVPGVLTLGSGVNDNRAGAFNTFVWGDDYSRTIGKHTLRAGGEIDRYQLNRFNNFAALGSVTFGSTPAGAGGVDIPALNGFQNFLLGRVTTTQAGSGIFNFAFRATDYALYVQDDWKVHPRLTLNLGLRWEGLSTAHENRNFLSNFRGLNDGTPGPISIIHPSGTPRVGTPGVSDCTLENCLDANNFAPRVGFAYDVFGNHRTVVRGGYGVYFQRISNQSLLQTSGGLPFQQTISAAPFSVTAENPFPNLLPASAFPLSTDQVVPKLVAFNGTTGAPIFNSTNGGPLSGFFSFPVRDLHAPYAQQWNFTIQHQLFKGWIGEVGYVGTRGVALLGPGRPLNAGQICTASSPCVIPASIASGVSVPAGAPFVTQSSNGTISITGSTPANVDARVPSQFIGLANSRGFFQENQGFSSYNALQATLSHQYSNGLYLQAAYTYSKSLDNGSGSTFGDELTGLVQYGGLLNPRSDFGLSDFDRTHRLVISHDYTLPFAKLLHTGADGLVGRLASGWSVNGVTTFQSGTPFIIIDSGAATLQDAGLVNLTNFATLPSGTFSSVLTPGSTESRLNNFVNLGAFLPGGNCVNDQNAVVARTSSACTGFAAVGNVGRNSFRGPFQQNFDFSLVKRTKATERVSLDFRAEFFNIFNHPSFQSPQAAGGSFGNYGIVDVASGNSSILATVNRPRIIQGALFVRF